jgi:hypothetical protein
MDITNIIRDTESKLIGLLNQKFSFSTDPMEIRSYFMNEDIVVSFDSSIEHDSRRYIFTLKEKLRRNNQPTPLQMECNGRIVYVDAQNNWITALNVPRVSTRHIPDVEAVAANIHDYAVYLLENGTSITLYYHHKWCIATNKGIEMNSVIQNMYTFEKILSMVLMERYDLSLNAFYDTLDKGYSHSFVLTHRYLHFFKSKMKGSGSLRYIQSVRSDNTIASPKQLPVPVQPMRTVDISELLSPLKTLFSRLHNMKSGRIPKNHLFGYKLVYNPSSAIASGDTTSDNDLQAHSFILESDLMRFVSYHCYYPDIYKEIKKKYEIGLYYATAIHLRRLYGQKEPAFADLRDIFCSELINSYTDVCSLEASFSHYIAREVTNQLTQHKEESKLECPFPKEYVNEYTLMFVSSNNIPVDLPREEMIKQLTRTIQARILEDLCGKKKKYRLHATLVKHKHRR